MKCQRGKFLLQRKYAYVNCAYMSPLMKKVENAGIKAIKQKRKPYKISADDFFSDTKALRLLFSQLINVDDTDNISVVPSVSYGMANVAQNLPRKGKIILAAGQFPSNVYPWLGLIEQGFKVEFIEPPTIVQKGKEWNERILNAIDKKTVMVAIGNVHWADGTLFNLQKIRERLDEVDGLLVVDGTQSVGALPFDAAEIRPDVLVCAGYKWLMGPYGIGLAYYSEKFTNGRPVEENWINRLNSQEFSGLVNYQDTYMPGAGRFSMGEQSSFVLVPMLRASIKQVISWSPAEIQEYCKTLVDPAIEKFNELGFGIESAEFRGNHLFGLQIPNGNSGNEVSAVLKQRKVSASIRGNTIRISPHVYNDHKDMNQLISALEEIVAN